MNGATRAAAPVLTPTRAAAPAGAGPVRGARRPTPLMALQQVAGNAAVGRLLLGGADEPRPGPSELDADRSATVTTGSAPIPRSPLTAAPADAPAEAVRRALERTGRPLPLAERARLQPSLPFDVATVRVHDDTPAQAASRALGALAFAFGPHVVLGGAPLESDRGRWLLAHELTHVARPEAGNPVLRRFSGEVKDVSSIEIAELEKNIRMKPDDTGHGTKGTWAMLWDKIKQRDDQVAALQKAAKSGSKEEATSQRLGGRWQWLRALRDVDPVTANSQPTRISNRTSRKKSRIVPRSRRGRIDGSPGASISSSRHWGSIGRSSGS